LARLGARFDPKEALISIGVGRTILKYRKREKIFSQGDAADAVFYIQKGTIKVSVHTEHGKKAALSVFGKGEFFGEGCLIQQSLRTATAAAITECTIMRFGKATITHLMRDEPPFSKMFVEHLLARKIRVEEDLVDQIVNSSKKRLARVLLRLADFGEDDKRVIVIEKVSHETLAEMVGTTRSRVCFFMNRFRESGFVSYDGTGPLEIRRSLHSVVLPAQPQIKS
jgi:CRP/FNR family cyclic AMP-dependent transcriptional regulator